jgi:glyoxylase-like metal-dependent hydrolase (beta-lactamase superfamily II)
MLSLILAAAAVAQDARPPAPPPGAQQTRDNIDVDALRKALDATSHRVQQVRDNVYAVFGQGGNVGVITHDDCVVMIDCQFERSLPGLLEAVKTISNKPIKYLINTHHHSDHTNANRAMSGQVQAIIAHANTKARLAKEQEGLEPEKRGGLPSIVIGEEGRVKTDTLTLAVGGTDVQMTYWGPAHTDNDMVIGVPKARVVHMGDTLFLEMLPYIDTESGGSFNGLVQIVGHVLGLLPEDALVIPGHGPVCDKKELTRHHEFLLAVQQHVRKNPEMSPKDLAESFDKAPWGDKKPSPQFVTWETLFQAAAVKGPGRVK